MKNIHFSFITVRNKYYKLFFLCSVKYSVFFNLAFNQWLSQEQSKNDWQHVRNAGKKRSTYEFKKNMNVDVPTGKKIIFQMKTVREANRLKVLIKWVNPVPAKSL